MVSFPAPAGEPDLTVVLMTYNEVECLSATVAEILAALEGMPCTSELLIVNDGSSDGSAALADRLAGERPAIRVIHHPENRGLGGVYSTGFAEARGRLLSFFPADGQFPASILPDFWSAADSADLVLGYLPDRPGALVAQAVSGVERMLYRILLGPMPRFQGIFMLRRELLSRIQLCSRGRGWGILMELVFRVSQSGYRVVSRPTPYRPRATGSSKVMNPRTALENFRQLFELRRRLRGGVKQQA